MMSIVASSPSTSKAALATKDIDAAAIPELLLLCDRIIVLHRGRVAAAIPAKATT